MLNIASAPPIRFHCTLCGFCCRFYTPLVTSDDARRIQGHLQKPLSSFVAFYRPEDFTIPLGTDERLFITKHGPLVMGLLRKEAACVFLKDELCSIHLFKPGICAAFPFEPVTSGDVDGPYNMLNSDPCQGHSTYDDEVKQEAARDSYKPFYYEYASYLGQLKAWNADPSSREQDIEEFLRSVGLDWWRFEIPSDNTQLSKKGGRNTNVTTWRPEAWRSPAWRSQA